MRASTLTVNKRQHRMLARLMMKFILMMAESAPTVSMIRVW